MRNNSHLSVCVCVYVYVYVCMCVREREHDIGLRASTTRDGNCAACVCWAECTRSSHTHTHISMHMHITSHACSMADNTQHAMLLIDSSHQHTLLCCACCHAGRGRIVGYGAHPCLGCARHATFSVTHTHTMSHQQMHAHKA